MEVVFATGVARTADAVRSFLIHVRGFPWTWHCEYNYEKGCLVLGYIPPPTCVDSLVVGFSKDDVLMHNAVVHVNDSYRYYGAMDHGANG